MLLVTRPQPSADATARRLRTAGRMAVVAPLLVATSRAPRAVDTRNVQCLIVTSPQAARALKAWKALHKIPTLAVGDATAKLLRKNGFTNVKSADGDAKAIRAYVRKNMKPAGGALLLATTPSAGRALAAALVQAGFKARRFSVYDIAWATALPIPAVTFLKNKKATGVMFYSPRTARTFVAAVKKARLMDCTKRLTAYCLSKAVARQARALSWRRVVAATAPNENALFKVL